MRRSGFFPSELPEHIARALEPRTLGRPVFTAKRAGWWGWLCVGAALGCQEPSHGGGGPGPRVHKAEGLDPFQGDQGRVQDRFTTWRAARRRAGYG